jgi:RNA polymerase sigma-70 factor (ECF subfamily)
MDFRRAAGRKMTVSLDESAAESNFSLLDTLRDPAPLPDEIAIEKESAYIIRKAIGILPRFMQEILILRDIQSCSYQEIAELLEIAEGTVKSRLFRARRQLMNNLHSEELKLQADRQSSKDKGRKGEVSDENVL